MAEQRPNILLIHTDQHRADCLGVTGNPDVRTPHIDALATEGTVYTHAFCPYPVCTPSRYSLLTGLYVHQHLGWTNRCTLPSGLATLPRVLRDHGYRTTAVGKMHFTPTYLDVGFDEMILAEQDGPGRHDDDYHRWLMDQGLCDRLDLMDQVQEYRRLAPEVYWDRVGALRSDLDEAHHSTTWIADQALRAMAGWQDGGNMLMVGFIKPHHPFDPPAPWDTMYDPAELTLLPGWVEQCSARDLARSSGYFPHADLSELRVRRAMAFYYATISQIDHQVGRLTCALADRGLLDNTIIVLTSDHGDYLGFHHLLLKGSYMYDPLVRVPLLIRFADGRGSVRVSPGLVSTIDVAPTLLRCAGCSVPSAMAGLDLRESGVGRSCVFAESGQGREYMARTATHKLLLGRTESEEDSLLFDLTQDPLETRDLSDDPSAAPDLARLRARLSDWSLFESASRVHVNAAAPCISGPNVPVAKGAEDRHDRSVAYFRRTFQRRAPV